MIYKRNNKFEMSFVYIFFFVVNIVLVSHFLNLKMLTMRPDDWGNVPEFGKNDWLPVFESR